MSDISTGPRRRSRRLLALLAPVGTLVGATALDARAVPTQVTLPLRVRVARCAGVDAPWVARQIEAAAAVYRRHGIVLRARPEPFAPRSCIALTRADRDAFAEHVADDGVPTVLVVGRVRDLDVLSYDLMGVHWRQRAAGRRWVFLTARAQPPVLAHELGHYLGLRHDPAGGNMMTPGPSDSIWRSARKPRPFAPLFTDAQVATLRRSALKHAAQRGR